MIKNLKNINFMRRYWFLFGLLLVFTITIGDFTETIPDMGKWLKTHQGPEIIIFLIFLISGLILDAGQTKMGLTDLKGILISLVIIFIAAPLFAVFFGVAPLSTSIKIGIFLIAVMPTTLSSGVVMTGASGGNMAHALVITIIANGLSVITIPITLSLLLNLIDSGGTEVYIDKIAIVIKLVNIVIVPLCLGLLIKSYGISKYSASFNFKKLEPQLQNLNKCFILMMVWMAVSLSKISIIQGKIIIPLVFLLAFIFHGFLLAVAWFLIRVFKFSRGRRESVLFMGGQKTLTLSIILQVSLFPQYGMALVVCVIHHILHLMMDAYLVARIKDADRTDDTALGRGD